MRIIGGSQRGRRLVGPKSPSIRPALDKVKQAIFNILGSVEGMRALDLFAGTGSIGIEALSRGAAFTVFVDWGYESLSLIRRNIRSLSCQDRTKILRLEIPRGLGRLRPLAPFHLVFVDPPYDKDLVNRTLRAIAREKILAPKGTVIVEHSPREPIDPDVGLTLFDHRKYGQTYVSFLRG